jgi:streptogramin lyase
MRTTNAIAQLGLASLTLLASACGGEPDVASTETLQPTGDEVEARATLTEGRNAHGSPPVPCGQVDEFPLPSTTGSLFPQDIVAGPDGNLWFSTFQSYLGRISPDDGSVSLVPIPVGGTRLAVARDRNIWLATSNGVGRYSPRRGTFEEIPIPALGAPVDITVGPDGNIWALAFANVARITLRGEVTLFPLPSTPFASTSDRIVAGPDGNLWYTAGIQLIHRLTLTGVVTDFSVPSSGTIFSLAAGPDDSIWFTQAGGGPNENSIGRITTRGVVSTVVQLPDSTLPPPSAPDNMPIDITAGPDGRMYFTTYLVVPKNYIGAVSRRGQLQRFEIPTAGAASFGITTGPDGNVWFTENFNNSIGRVEIASCHPRRHWRPAEAGGLD